MFLKSLNQQDKSLFLELAMHIACVDNEFHDAEEFLINEYRKEMGLIDYTLMNIDIEKIIDYFKNSTSNVKKIVYFESILLINADKKTATEEVEFVKRLKMEFEISDQLEKCINNWVNNSLSEMIEICIELSNKEIEIIDMLSL